MMEISNNNIYIQRVNLLFFSLIGLNIFSYSFIAGSITITLYEIISTNQSVQFLKGINELPFTPPLMFSIYTIALLLIILIIMNYRSKSKLEGKWSACLFLIEIILSYLLMYILGFSSNAILLLLMADIMNTFTDSKLRNFLLLITVITFLLTSTTFMPMFETTSFREYMEIYNGSLQFTMQALDTVFYTLNLVVFIAYMAALVQVEMNESKDVMSRNLKLQSLNEQLTELAEMSEKMGETRERNRLAREIHDTLGHTLTGLSVGLDAAIMTSDIDIQATKKQLSVLSDAARQGLTDVRRSVNKLRPDALEKNSLAKALEKMVNDFKNVSGVDIVYLCNLKSLEFNKEIEELLYRLTQEGMTNAIRHGKAQHIEISLALENNKLVYIMKDDGIGSKDIKDGFGLHHMRERITMMNGSLKLNGSEGFEIVAEIPVRKGVQND